MYIWLCIRENYNVYVERGMNMNIFIWFDFLIRKIINVLIKRYTCGIESEYGDDCEGKKGD